MKPVLCVLSALLLFAACKKKSNSNNIVANGKTNAYTGLKTITARKAFFYTSGGSFFNDTVLITYTITYDGMYIKTMTPNTHADLFGNYAFTYQNGNLASITCSYPASAFNTTSYSRTRTFTYNTDNTVDSVFFSYSDTTGALRKYAFQYSNGNLEKIYLGYQDSGHIKWNDTYHCTYVASNGNITQVFEPIYIYPFRCDLSQSTNNFSSSLPIWTIMGAVVRNTDDLQLYPVCMNKNLVDSLNIGTSLYAGWGYNYELTNGKITRMVEFQKGGRTHTDTVWFTY